jgi:hypothetical protein
VIFIKHALFLYSYSVFRGKIECVAERRAEREVEREGEDTKRAILMDLRRSHAIMEMERWSRGYTKGKTIERECELHQSNHLFVVFVPRSVQF